jgi:hypothetical protein
MTRKTFQRAGSVLAVTIVLVAAACGGDNTAGGDPGGVPPSAGAPIPGGGLSIDEAIASTLPGPLTVKGFLVAPEGEPVRLCSLLAESYPPQCGGSSLVVEGLDLATVEGLTSTNDPELAQVTWSQSEVSLPGDVEDGVLTVSETSI